jgi:flagellar hook-associated protein 2
MSNLSGINLDPTSATSGSGIDVTSVVNQILEAERAPERLWQQQQSSLTTQTAALNALNSSLSALKTSVDALKDVSGALTGMQADSSDASILTANAQTSAAPGTHVIAVNNLATKSSLYSDALNSSSTPFAPGTISLSLGGGPAVDIQVDTFNTIDGLASYINQNSLGVTASAVRDASGSRIALVSQTTGSAGDLTITANTTGLKLNKSVTGKNASLSVDGVPISSASNIVTGALDGVTVNLASAAPDSPVLLSVGPDVSRAKQAIQSFVSSYNTVTTGINNQFSFNSASNSAGPLAGDSALRSLQTSLLSDMTYSTGVDGPISSLASLGISMANDGTLSMDDKKLTAALSDHFADLLSFFQSTDISGFARHFATDLGGLTDSTEGILNLRLAENTSTQKMLTDRINDLEDRLTARQQELIQQYSKVDTALREFPLLMAQINSQLNSLQAFKK